MVIPREYGSARRSPRSRRGRWVWLVTVPLVGLLVLIMVLSFIDEPLRAYAERQVNQRLPAYDVRIGSLALHPIRLSIDLEDVIVRQKDHLDPPIAAISKIHGSIQWRTLFAGRLVSDQSIDHPVIHFTRSQVENELEASSEREQSWQELLFAMHEFQLNEIRITNGEVRYRQNANSKPLHITGLNVHAENIRNVRSKPQQYPSDLHLEARVFEEGRVQLDGHADFFAEPTMAVNANVTLTDITLADLLPLTAQYQVHLSQGVLSAEGHVEYAPTVQEVRLRTFSLFEAKADFIHSVRTERKVKETGEKAAQAAEQAANHPTLLLRIDEGKIQNSEFGLVNKATDPPYRVFISNTEIELENWSNQLSEGTAIVRLNGLLMGTGETTISGAFRPEAKSPDFDLSVKILRTQVKSLNQLLRAYGGMDVASGIFSVYSEVTVKDDKVRGYLKPLFKDVTAYEPAQDQDKSILEKIYEKTINVAAELLKNASREEVATRTDVSGPVENPQANTWELVLTLFKNAFIDAVLPGLEGKRQKTG